VKEVGEGEDGGEQRGKGEKKVGGAWWGEIIRKRRREK